MVKTVNKGINSNIIDQFEKLIIQTKNTINNENDKQKKLNERFRLKNFEKVLLILKGVKKEIKSGKDIKKIDGVTQKTIDRIDEIIKKGNLKEVKLSKSDNTKIDIISSLTKIIGIGDKKASELYKLGVTSPENLKKQIKQNKIEVNDIVKMGLKYFEVLKDKIPRKEMKKIEAVLLSVVGNIDKKIKGKILGSYRREQETSNDIDFTITHPNLKTKDDLTDSDTKYIYKIIKKLKKEGYILDDLINNPDKTYRGFFKLGKKYPVRQLDIKIVPFESYPTAILHSTGSSLFNEYIRGIAKKKGYKLNEYGLYKLKKNKNNKIKEILINIKTEKDIFNELDLDYVEPSKRITGFHKTS